MSSPTVPKRILLILTVVLAGALIVGVMMCSHQSAPVIPSRTKAKPEPPVKEPKKVVPPDTSPPDASPPDASSPDADPALAPPTSSQAGRLYRWKRRHAGYLPLSVRFPAPGGYARVPAARGTYQWWLRHLPLFPKGRAVKDFKGDLLHGAGDSGLAAVVDLDLRRVDRQHCADTIMRLRGEYLFSRGKEDRVRFRWSGGKYFGYGQWRKGIRPEKEGRRYVFKAVKKPGSGRKHFRKYLEYIFSWTGTMNMAGERRVAPAQMRAGDFFIKGGSPGHTIVVLDIVRDPAGRTRLLLGQGFMPAQDMHVLRAKNGSPWWDWDANKTVLTNPYWYGTFNGTNLKRFRY